jgi:protein-S-isoprenylcysteine O-methyltransferase Ste14
MSAPGTERVAEQPTWLSSSAVDLLARTALVLLLTFFVLAYVTTAIETAQNWEHQSLTHTLLVIAARISNALFFALAVATTITRLRPIRKAAGLEPRVSALLGSFLLLSLALLPRSQASDIILGVSSALVIIGMSLSFTVLRWLGKSFSIMAEARRLVTGGPYAIVRHPLYICEEIAIIGILIQVMSPLAVLIVLAHALIQFRRMLNEEKVLGATFPEYDDYATRTPRLIPAWRVWPVFISGASGQLPARTELGSPFQRGGEASPPESITTACGWNYGLAQITPGRNADQRLLPRSVEQRALAD